MKKIALSDGPYCKSNVNSGTETSATNLMFLW